LVREKVRLSFANYLQEPHETIQERSYELPEDGRTSSAPIIQHPDIPGTLAYKTTTFQTALSDSAQILKTFNTLLQLNSAPSPSSECAFTLADPTTLFLHPLLSTG
jgi:hypothetical protein